MSETIATAQSRTQSRPATPYISDSTPRARPCDRSTQEIAGLPRSVRPTESLHAKLLHTTGSCGSLALVSQIQVTGQRGGSFDLRIRDQTVQPLGSIRPIILFCPYFSINE